MFLLTTPTKSDDLTGGMELQGHTDWQGQLVEEVAGTEGRNITNLIRCSVELSSFIDTSNKS